MPRGLGFVFAFVGLSGLSMPASAQAPPPVAGGNIQLSWDQCAPIVVNKNAFAGPMEFYASVQGHSLPHQAYELWVIMGDNQRSLPDAWRFDDQGCNAGRSLISAAEPAAQISKTCPSFVPVAVERTETGQFTLAPPSLGYATTLGAASLVVAYPNGGSGSPNHDPAQRYFLGRFQFDHTFSSPGSSPTGGTTCGGLEAGMCLLALSERCGWTDLEGVGFRFGNAIKDFLIVNGGTVGCGATPAETTTWGSIKAQYKH